MPKLLIADHLEGRQEALKKAMDTEWEIHTCLDSYPVVDTMRYLKPEAMVIDLNIGPQNGLTILKESFPELPPVILALTNLISPYIVQTAESLGVSMLVQIPCKIDFVKEQLENMYQAYLESPSLLSRHLQKLGISNTLAGYRCLLAAIPLFQANPNLMIKEVFPEVAKLCNLSDGRNVEHCVRTAIRNAWKHRDPKVWDYYFPGLTRRPSNKIFILRIAQLLQ